MKRATNRQPIALVPQATPKPPFVEGAWATRQVTVSVISPIQTPKELLTNVKVVLGTDTERRTLGAVGICLEISRPLDEAHRGRFRVGFDFAVSELDVLLTALTEAVKLARSSGVIAEPLAECAAVLDPSAA